MQSGIPIPSRYLLLCIELPLRCGCLLNTRASPSALLHCNTLYTLLSFIHCYTLLYFLYTAIHCTHYSTHYCTFIHCNTLYTLLYFYTVQYTVHIIVLLYTAIHCTHYCTFIHCNTLYTLLYFYTLQYTVHILYFYTLQYTVHILYFYTLQYTVHILYFYTLLHNKVHIIVLLPDFSTGMQLAHVGLSRHSLICSLSLISFSELASHYTTQTAAVYLWGL